jgi:hypothetical protein
VSNPPANSLGSSLIESLTLKDMLKLEQQQLAELPITSAALLTQFIAL